MTIFHFACHMCTERKWQRTLSTSTWHMEFSIQAMHSSHTYYTYSIRRLEYPKPYSGASDRISDFVAVSFSTILASFYWYELSLAGMWQQTKPEPWACLHGIMSPTPLWFSSRTICGLMIAVVAIIQIWQLHFIQWLWPYEYLWKLVRWTGNDTGLTHFMLENFKPGSRFPSRNLFDYNM